MYNPDTDLLFPPRVIPILCNERGEAWRDLVARVAASEEESTAHLAFILMMARLNNCTACNADSFRAMQGCTFCSKQALKRFHGTDEELTGLFQEAKAEVEQYLQKKI
jgi:hypothetical protein